MTEEESRRILIVDDESSVCDIIQRTLQQAGYRLIAQANSVPAARRRIEQEGPFALVILDITMPGESGMILLKELAPLAPQTVTIMATGFSGIETAVRALKMGAYDYLVKPLILDAVQIAVARALRKRLLELNVLERREQIEKLVLDRTEALEATRHALLKALCHMAEFRDAQIGGHLRRVPEYARVLALDLAQNSYHADRITEPFISRLVESAPLHDIGKVGVPDSILLKPGKLTPVEFEQVKLHTVRGRDICMSVKKHVGDEASSFIDVAVEVTYGHHEWWDGRGYPEGRMGPDCPLSGRIVHLADFYDACRSPRVYRPEPMPRDVVIRTIQNGRGADFDPEVADAFMRTIDRFAAVEEISDYTYK
jgi:putative two-component system response regulator